MRGRVALYVLLTVVAGAAAVLSFAALRDLALLVGFAPTLAPLLPVTVDAGAAAGSLVWLSRHSGAAAGFGRTLALTLLGASVAGNALGHGLIAYGTRPAWWVVVAVSSVPPAVLGAVVHLAVRATQAHTTATADDPVDEAVSHPRETAPPAGDPPGADQVSELGVARTGVTDDPVDEPWSDVHRGGEDLDGDGVSHPRETAPPAGDPPGADRARALIAAGAGRRRLSRELGVSEHEARELLAAHRDRTHSRHQVVGS